MNKEEFRETYWKNYQNNFKEGKASYMTYHEVERFAELAWGIFSAVICQFKQDIADLGICEECEEEQKRLESNGCYPPMYCSRCWNDRTSFLIKQKDDFRKLYEDVLTQMQLKIQDYDVLQKSIGRLQQTIIDKDVRIEKLTDEVREQKSWLTECHEENDKLEGALSYWQKIYDEVCEKLQTEQDNNLGCQEELSHLKTINSKYENDLAYWFDKHNLEMGKNLKLEERVKELEKEIKELRDIPTINYNVLSREDLIAAVKQLLIVAQDQDKQRAKMLTSSFNSSQRYSEMIKRVKSLEKALRFYSDVDNLLEFLERDRESVCTCMLLYDITTRATQALIESPPPTS